MRDSERYKISEAILKIKSGEFFESDVLLLFIGLRNYCGGHKLFREIADAFAHSNERDEGIVNNSLDLLYLNIRYRMDYSFQSKALDICSWFPLYVLRLLRLQLAKRTEEDLKIATGYNSSKIKTIIDTSFEVNKKDCTAKIKDKGLKNNEARAIEYLLSFVSGRPAFEAADLLEEIISVARENNFELESNVFLVNKAKILLSVALLMHDMPFKLSSGSYAKCYIAPELVYPENFDPIVDPVDWCLVLRGKCDFDTEHGPRSVEFTVFDTKLSALEHCDESVFVFNENAGPWLYLRYTPLLSRPLKLVGDRLAPI